MKNGFIGLNDIKSLYRSFGFDVTRKCYSIQNQKGEYKTIYKFPVDRLLKKHLEGKFSVCLSSYAFSKIFQIDIDCKDGIIEKTQDIIKKLVSEIGEPVFIEKSSKDTGGYHLYYKFTTSNKSMLSVWEEFQKYFNAKYKSAIEIMKGDKRLKLPFSLYYNTHGTYDSSDINLINKKEKYECIEIIDTANEREFPLMAQMKSIIKEKNIDLKNLIKVPAKVSDGTKTGWKDYYYSAGTRWENQKCLAVRTVCAGGTFEDFVEECYKYDLGSRDMTTWKTKGTVNKHLMQIYKYFESRCSTNTEYINQHAFDKTIDGKQLVLKIDPDKILTQKEEYKFRELLGKIYQDKNKTPKHKLNRINGLVKLYKVIIAMFQGKVDYVPEFGFLNDGVMLNQELLRLIGKSQDISNPEEKFNTLKNLKLFKAIKGADGRSYCYEREKEHFAIHYKPMSLLKVFAALEELFKNWLCAIKLDLKSLMQKINIENFSELENIIIDKGKTNCAIT